MSLFIPILVGLFLRIKYNKNFSLLEYGACILFTIFILFIGRTIGLHSAALDWEYWNGYAQTAEYYEDWNELVVYTETHTYTDSEGNSHSYTDTHTRINYHPEYFQINTTLGSYNISKQQYYVLVKMWGNQCFIDLHRGYYSNDGDKYATRYDTIFEHTVPVTDSHLYTNKVGHSTNVFNFKPLSKEEKKLVYEHPKRDTFNFKYILGYKNPTANKILAIHNGLMGAEKKITMFILIWDNVTSNTIENAYLQQRFWRGGNKNELITCIGVENNKVTWVKVFSWSDSETMKADIESLILKNKTFDIYKIIDIISSQAKQFWVKKDFRVFDYLEVQLPLWGNLIIILLSFLGCGVTMAVSLNTQEEE